jgi:hypothetical protein
MSDRKTFPIKSSAVRAAMLSSDGASAFDNAPVILENMDPPGELLQVQEWGDVFVVGDALTNADLKALVRSDQALHFPTTSTPPNAAVWVLRRNFPNREAALYEASTARIVAKEHRAPGRRGEQVFLLVNAKEGQKVLELWQGRMTLEGVMEWNGGEYADARDLFLASLAIGVRDVHDIYRVIVANLMVGDDGVEARVLAYANLAKRWAKKHGRGVESLRQSFAGVCADLGLDDGQAREWGEKVLRKGGVAQ